MRRLGLDYRLWVRCLVGPGASGEGLPARQPQKEDPKLTWDIGVDSRAEVSLSCGYEMDEKLEGCNEGRFGP